MKGPMPAAPAVSLPAPPGAAPPGARPRPTAWPGFHDLDLVRPGVSLLLDVGASAGARLVHGLVAGGTGDGREVVVVDGANSLDVYRLGEEAARLGLPRGDVLDRVHVARGFTVYQYQTLVEQQVPDLVARLGERTGLVVASMFPELYLDVDVPPRRAAALAGRALAVLRRVARDHDVPVVVTNATLAPSGRHDLRRVLEAGVDEVAGLHPEPGGGLVVRVPGRGIVALLPGAGTRQRRLTEYVDARPVHAVAEGHFSVHLPDVHLRRMAEAVKHVRYVPRRAGEARWMRGQRARGVLGDGTH